jgi:hypothetical protein
MQTCKQDELSFYLASFTLARQGKARQTLMPQSATTNKEEIFLSVDNNKS